MIRIGIVMVNRALHIHANVEPNTAEQTRSRHNAEDWPSMHRIIVCTGQSVCSLNGHVRDGDRRRYYALGMGL